MVGAENLAPANALMSTVESAGWTVGPGLGGLLMTVTGPEVAATAAAGIAAVGAVLALSARGSRWPAAVARAEPFLSRSGAVCGPSSPPRRSPSHSCWSS